MSLVKKITICTGIDENGKPIWAQPQSIGVDSVNVVFPNENYGNILFLNSEGQIQVSNIPISWLQEKYEEENSSEL